MEKPNYEEIAKEITLEWLRMTAQSSDPKKAAENISLFYLELVKQLKSNAS